MRALFLPRLAFVSALALAVSGCADYPTIPDDVGGDDGDDDDDNGPGDGPGSGIDLGNGGAPIQEEPSNEDNYECGNGELEPGEICDDGGTEGGDGCSANCLDQNPEFDCSIPGEACRDTVVCGNGVLEGNEECDDDDDDAGDGCSGSCMVEDGYVCIRPGTDCLIPPECGNGELERGEECDDGNDTSPTDGCHECALADGFFCLPGSACVQIVCGDANRTPNEECDDGPGELGSPGTPVGSDGCSATCEVEDGYRCGANGCKTICGDGIKLGTEECDDGDRISGNGCSAGCKEEPFYTCTGQGEGSCTSDIQCGNSTLEPGEICDPPGTAGCLAGCKSFNPDVTGGAVCGNHVIEYGEECDAPGAGCDAGCQELDGWQCLRPDQCTQLPVCGDSILHLSEGEECDDGDGGGDGCNDCVVENGWSCSGLTNSVCVQEICGDGIRTPSEECDEGMGTTTAGCVSCEVTTGWACPTAGAPCIERCGDGRKVGTEECDDGDDDNGDGCNVACRIEPGFNCTTNGTNPSTCTGTVCGNGVEEAGESCDDGNAIAGDNCSATCQDEPTITRVDVDTPAYPTPTVNVKCGDGLITGNPATIGDEAFVGDASNPAGCDDGNNLNGDGCSATCKVEDGYVCPPYVDYPDEVQMQVTLRDWMTDDVNRGHPDFENGSGTADGVPGPICTSTANGKCTAAAGATCAANTCGHLDSEGKPVFHLSNGTSKVSSANSFATWYRNGTAATDTSNSTLTNDYDNAYGVMDVSNGNQYLSRTAVFTESITLDAVDGSPGTYFFNNNGNQFFPLSGRGLGNEGRSNNYHFTTELRYFFQYQGGETLTFSGDDDVWVFVNGKLAVDIGGVHCALAGRVVLGDTDSSCSLHRYDIDGDCALTGAEPACTDTSFADTDSRFGITKGGVYEIVLFNAERQTSQSNFNLTLAGFIPPRSFCQPDCGDGEVVGYEVCDDGDDNSADPASGECNDTCTARAYCGDGDTQDGEECDNGTNLDLYDTGLAGQCAPGCVLPPSCGDGEIQAAYELCDNGDLNSDTAYGPTSCNDSCGVGLYCGDDIPTNPPEACDDGDANGTTYGPLSCGYDCQAGPRCGDGIRNGAEECDDGEGNSNTVGARCSTTCTVQPHCGDGIVSTGEECDLGQFNTATPGYGGCDEECDLGPHCGDGIADEEDGGEECDNGFNTDTYDDGTPDVCAEGCLLPPSCGDGVVQEGTDEECDNGFNEDTYLTSEDACGLGCSTVPYCGDGELDSAFEYCDEGDENDGRYGGCTAECEFSAYCGDDHIDAPDEECDDGADNTAYSATGEACGYDCKPAAYCGDKVRNGPEQCDLGTSKNTGAYGGCKADCTRAPYCGDRKVQAGEACDEGPAGSLTCSSTCQLRSNIR